MNHAVTARSPRAVVVAPAIASVATKAGAVSTSGTSPRAGADAASTFSAAPLSHVKKAGVENFTRAPYHFESDITRDDGSRGTGKMDGELYLPKGAQKAPVIVPCSGFTGVRSFYPEIVGSALANRGFACYAFDYSGHGKSAGREGYVTVEEQRAAIKNAVKQLASDPQFAGRPIVLWGWGMAGGMALQAAAELKAENGGKEMVAGIVSGNGIFDVERAQQDVHGGRGTSFELARAKLATTRAEHGPLHKVPSYDIYALDKETNDVVVEKLVTHPGYVGNEVDVAFSESFFGMKADAAETTAALRDTPVLAFHGEANELHPISQSKTMLAKLPGDDKTLVTISGRRHNDFMVSNDPDFVRMMDNTAAWVNRVAPTVVAEA